ncbi:MAG: glycosyl hydrolase family 28-related protein [Terriglobales bacterium]
MISELVSPRTTRATIWRTARWRIAAILIAAWTISPYGISQTSSQSAASAEPHYPPIFDVEDFGAAGDGKTLDTPAITRAIHAAATARGGSVLFPPGSYRTGTFELLSNITLDLTAGAVILGSNNIADYAAITDYGFGKTYGVNSTGEGDLVGIIVARNAENIAIVGQGVIDGNADGFSDFKKPHYGMDFDPRYTRQGENLLKSMLETADGPVETKPAGRPGTMIVFFNCQNIVIRDVTLRNAPNWTFHLGNSRKAVIAGVHILNSLLLPNNDGIDCIVCRDVHISDCEIRAGDDDFAFFGSEDVSVSNCSLVSHSSGLRIEDTRSSVFTNLSIHSNRGIGIYERAGTTANLVFSDIVIQTQLLTGHWWGKGEAIFIAVSSPRDQGKHGEARDLQFSNIVGEGEGGLVMYGDSNSWVHNVHLDRIALRVRAPRKLAAELADGNFDFRWTATSLANAVFKHDIPGLYCRYIDGLRIHDFSLAWDENLPEYFSNGIECEDFRHLDLDQFEGRQASVASSVPAIVLRRGQDVFVRNSKAAPGTSTFLSTSNVKEQGVFVGNDLRGAKRVFHAGQNRFLMSGNYLPDKNARPAGR